MTGSRGGGGGEQGRGDPPDLSRRANTPDLLFSPLPQGGQLCVSAQLQDPPTRKSEGGGGGSGALLMRPLVQLLIIHTGCIVLDRMHVVQAATTGATAGSGSGAGSGGGRLVAAVGAAGASGRSTAALLPQQQQRLTSKPSGDGYRSSFPAASSSASSSASPPQVGGGLLSFSMAEELVVAAGGSVSVSHRVPMVNALSNQVDTATCIEVLLPALSPH